MCNCTFIVVRLAAATATATFKCILLNIVFESKVVSRNNYSATAGKDIKYTLRQCSIINDTSLLFVLVNFAVRFFLFYFGRRAWKSLSYFFFCYVRRAHLPFPSRSSWSMIFFWHSKRELIISNVFFCLQADIECLYDFYLSKGGP